MSWDFVGNEWTIKMLQEHIAQGHIRHAYLFTGPDGSGRRTLALRLAQAVNCTQPPAPGEPCGVCPACIRIAKMSHPDLTIVEPEVAGGSLKVEQIRAVQHTLALAPYEARYRVALLLGFEQATESAQNALLKTLEEPNPQVIILLTAESAENLLPTITSRCEVLRLQPLPLQALEQALVDRWEIEPEKAHLLAHLSAGRPGMATFYHENDDLLKARLAAVDQHLSLLVDNRLHRFAFVDKWARDRKLWDLREEIRYMLVVWLSFWRDVLLRTTGAAVPITNIYHETEVDKIAAKLKLAEAKLYVGAVEKALERVDKNVNPRLTLEVLLLDLPKI